MTVIWCFYNNPPPKYYRVHPVIDYISINEELVTICPIILASHAGLHYEATIDDIHMRDRNAVYRMDNNIFP